MWWLVTLLVLALVSFFIVKSMKASTQSTQAEHDSLQNERLDAVSSTGIQPPATEVSGNSPDTDTQAQAAVGVAAAGVAAGSVGSASTAPAPSPTGGTSLDTGNTLADVREMIKILNLDGPDAHRLDISREELSALRKGESSGIPDASSLANVATKLRQMLA